VKDKITLQEKIVQGKHRFVALPLANPTKHGKLTPNIIIIRLLNTPWIHGSETLRGSTTDV
jgi:hypothetical protein